MEDNLQKGTVLQVLDQNVGLWYEAVIKDVKDDLFVVHYPQFKNMTESIQKGKSVSSDIMQLELDLYVFNLFFQHTEALYMI